MKKQKKLIILGLVVMLLLGGVIAALALIGQEEEVVEEEIVTEEEETTRLLYEKAEEAIVSVTVENSNGTYYIERCDDGESWTVPEFEGHELYTSGITGVISVACELTAQQVVKEDCEDISIYGLDDPTYRVTIVFDGDDTKTILVGDEVPTGTYSYMCFEGETTVYTVKTSSLSVYAQSKYYFVQKTVYTAYESSDEDDETDYTKVNKITIQRKDIDYDIVLEYDTRQDDEDAITGNSSTHVMTEPVSLDLNPDTADDCLTGMFGLAASGVAVMSPTEEDLEAYGIADPYAVIDFNIVGGSFQLVVGNELEVGGYYYAMAEDFDIIFIFDADDLPWVTIMPMDITMTLITSNYIYNVTKLTVETAGETYTFRLSGDSDDFYVKYSGELIDADSFKTFYQYILKAPAEELYLEDTDAEPSVTVTIKTASGEDVIEFIPDEDRMTIIRLNGRVSFRCRTAYADRLAENLTNLLNGDDIISVW